MENKLETARQIINEADKQMAELFVKRMQAAQLVFEHKKEYGLPILDQKREEAVIAANTARIDDDGLKGYYVDFLKHLMTLSREYQYTMQRSMKVACPGTAGDLSSVMAGRIFLEGCLVSCLDPAAAYRAVVTGDCDAAVLSLEMGLDLIYAGDLFVNGIYEAIAVAAEEERPARFAVLSKKKAESPAFRCSVILFTPKASYEDAISILEEYGFQTDLLERKAMAGNPGEQYCYAEIDGSIKTDTHGDLMEALEQVCDRVKIAGSFAPHAVI